MSTELLLRGFFSFIIACTLAYSIYYKNDRESSPLSEGDNRQKYAPYVPAFIYPLFFAVIFIISAGKLGISVALSETLQLCFDVFLSISVYYFILLLILPLLRKYISARVCAALWIIPNYQYFIHMSFTSLPKPLLVLHVPSDTAETVCLIWGMGFIGVMLVKVISHLLFRHRILRNSRDVADSEITELWQEEQRAAGIKKANYRLVYSPDIRTPLSVGFFRRTTRVILPKRSYTPDELLLIFRHELVHIGREDSTTKFFMTFCMAMCWFNPLMWIAVRRSADDMELSCDETVLLDAGYKVRRQYADLILSTAENDRGFTTCLSSSSNSLRYRLKNIVKPRKRFAGGITAGLIFFSLVMSCGHIALAYDEGVGHEYIFSSGSLSDYSIDSVSKHDEDGFRFYSCTDETALNKYLSELRFFEITGSYTFPEEENQLSIMYNGPNGVFGVTLRDSALKITPLYGNRITSVFYCYPQNIDWEYIYSLITPG